MRTNDGFYGNNSDKYSINSNKSRINSIKKSKEKKTKEKEIKEKYIKGTKNEKHKYGEYQHVTLSDEQHKRLIETYGLEIVENYIRKIDEWCQLHGKHYDDYNLAIRNWIRRDNNNAENKRIDEQSSDTNEWNGTIL